MLRFSARLLRAADESKAASTFKKKGQIKQQPKGKKEGSTSSNFDTAAMSLRNTVVKLNRTDADLAAEAALVAAYSRGKNAQALAVQRREKLLLQLKDDAICNLPPLFRAAALEADASPVPNEINPPTHTPPIEGYDPQESFARQTQN